MKTKRQQMFQSQMYYYININTEFNQINILLKKLGVVRIVVLLRIVTYLTQWMVYLSLT